MLNYKRHIVFLFFTLFIYSFSIASNPDSALVIKSWKFDSFFDNHFTSIDSTLNDFQIYNPMQKLSFSNSYLGTLASPSISNILLDYNYFDNYFLNTINPFLFSYHNIQFYDTKKPFSSVFYSNGAQEQSLDVFHTRNVNKKLNFGFRYNLVSSVGFYKRQKTKKNSFTIFSSYISKFYNLHTNFAYNKFMYYENGGLETLVNFSEYISPEFFGVNLDNASSTIKYTSAFLSQEFRLGYNKDILDSSKTDTSNVNNRKFVHLASLQHVLEYYKTYRVYEDVNPLSGFYNGVKTDSIDYLNDSTIVPYIDFNSIPIFMDSTATFDSIAQRLFANTFQLKLNEQKFKVGARVGFYHEILKYSLPCLDSLNVVDSILFPYKTHFDTLYFNSAIFAGIYNNFNKKLNWYLNTKYFISGHRNSNFEVSGFIRKNFFSKDSISNLRSSISLSANFSRKAPDFFEENYYSNHYQWDSTFLAKDVTSIKLFYSIPVWNLSLGVTSNIFDNFIYYNEIAQPTQTTSTYNVYSGYLIKNFTLGNFHFNNQLVYQDNGNKTVLRIPSIIFFNSTYVNFNLFKKVLNVNLGFDFYYYDEYYGYAYKPATGVFYIQNDDLVGNYPLLDVFLRLKLKRARFFLKVTHVNYMLTNTTPLYTLSKYPINGRTLKMGISWNFYD
ncbi:MAG: hypothetical protein A2W98_05810 [Bacteroidetes bacterium GWF2_33_38]|nr:MAG: hypothetical protein A2W98_05810 [Bacteroidetes bacterium GWF2_33_38]HBX51677.1 hypothetical protein [Bacteroidales bacterium]